MVFLGHVAGQRFTHGLFWQFGPLMDAAVVIFFVLSGYVIAFTADTKEKTAREYFSARAARIYSVALPAVVLAAILDPIGRHFSPGLYASWWGYDGTNPVLHALMDLAFANQIWNLNVAFGSLIPYWSLGYEVWYYAFFGIALFSAGWLRFLLLVFIAALIGPKILELFPLWLAGALAYQISKSVSVSKELGRFIFYNSLAALAVLVYLIDTGRFAHVPLVLARYIEGAVFLANIVGAQACGDYAQILLPAKAPIRYLAGMTFTLYLMHLPIAQAIASISPLPAQSLAERLIILGGTFLAVLAISHVTERRKKIWRKFIDRLAFAPIPSVAHQPD